VVATLAGGLVERGECVGLAVSVRHGGVEGFYAYGEVERGSGRLPAPTTEFGIASITKLFSATLLVLYARRQLLTLDAPLQMYVPQGTTVPSWSGRQITLLDLATHTSGLPLQPPMRGGGYSSAEMFAFLGSYRLSRAPGAQFEYSFLGGALLAHALAKAAGMPWEALVERDITSKLGMPDTRLKLELDEGQRARLAIGYNEAGARAIEQMPSWPAFTGSNALFSTVNDMQRFLSWNMGELKSDLDDLLDDLHRPRFTLPGPGAEIGLTWQMAKLGKSGSSIVWKYGSALGHSAYIGFVRGAKSGIVVLANAMQAPLARVGRQVLAALSE
jgi:CubicO group peptidase (beta-lactamase class C family)